MTVLYAIAQDTVIALAVAWSVVYAARRLVPTASRRVQSRIAAWLGKRGHARWAQRLAARIEPVQTASGGCGSSGCSTCGACSPAPRTESLPLNVQPRPK